MPYNSPFTIDIPTTDLLTYLFPPAKNSSEKPLWISVTDPSISLSHKHALQWIRRLAVGLGRLQLSIGDVVLTISPNHVYVPVAYLGSIGHGAVFSGLSPAASVNGKYISLLIPVSHIYCVLMIPRNGIPDETHWSKSRPSASKCLVNRIGSSENRKPAQRPHIPILRGRLW